MTIKEKLSIEFSDNEERENVLTFLDVLDDFCNCHPSCDTCPFRNVCDNVDCNALYALARGIKKLLQDNEV